MICLYNNFHHLGKWLIFVKYLNMMSSNRLPGQVQLIDHFNIVWRLLENFTLSGALLTKSLSVKDCLCCQRREGDLCSHTCWCRGASYYTIAILKTYTGMTKHCSCFTAQYVIKKFYSCSVYSKWSAYLSQESWTLLLLS